MLVSCVWYADHEQLSLHAAWIITALFSHSSVVKFLKAIQVARGKCAFQNKLISIFSFISLLASPFTSTHSAHPRVNSRLPSLYHQSEDRPEMWYRVSKDSTLYQRNCIRAPSILSAVRTDRSKFLQRSAVAYHASPLKVMANKHLERIKAPDYMCVCVLVYVETFKEAKSKDGYLTQASVYNIGTKCSLIGGSCGCRVVVWLCS